MTDHWQAVGLPAFRKLVIRCTIKTTDRWSDGVDHGYRMILYRRTLGPGIQVDVLDSPSHCFRQSNHLSWP